MKQAEESGDFIFIPPAEEAEGEDFQDAKSTDAADVSTNISPGAKLAKCKGLLILCSNQLLFLPFTSAVC